MLVNNNGNLVGVVSRARYGPDRYGNRMAVGGVATPSFVIFQLIKQAMRNGWSPKSLEEVAQNNAAIDLAEYAPDELAQRILDSDSNLQDAILFELHQRKGKSSTMGMLTAIDNLPDDRKKHAEELLIRRLRRMKSTTLANYLKKDSSLLCSSAAKAAETKREKSVAPELVELLIHSNNAVNGAANDALKSIFGQDFGDTTNASLVRRFSIQRRWKQWIDQNT